MWSSWWRSPCFRTKHWTPIMSRKNVLHLKHFCSFVVSQVLPFSICVSGCLININEIPCHDYWFHKWTIFYILWISKYLNSKCTITLGIIIICQVESCVWRSAPGSVDRQGYRYECPPWRPSPCPRGGCGGGDRCWWWRCPPPCPGTRPTAPSGHGLWCREVDYH